jgi:hypothetical protein
MRLHTRTLFWTLLALGCLSACSTTDKTAGRMGDAAITPLSDLNLKREAIPAVLLDAGHAPYAIPADRSCEALRASLHQLDLALGPDLDAPDSASDPSLLDRGTDALENKAVGMVQSTAEGLIPFRSWVRKLTGAERHARKVAAAIAAGGVRRAFLKGWGQAQGCDWRAEASVATAATPASAP